MLAPLKSGAFSVPLGLRFVLLCFLVGLINQLKNVAEIIILVVDDICDGGGTFLLLAEALRKAGIDNNLELYVSHGIFSKGTDIIYKSFYPIYTTNSFFRGYDSNVKVHNLKEYFYETDISKGK